MTTAHKGISRQDQASFVVKSTLLKVRRAGQDTLAGMRKWPPSQALSGAILSEVSTDLFTSREPEEQELQLGKVQNLRIAARAFDGVVVPRGETLSFWRQLGRPTRARGFVAGRELRQGCLIPTLGGGLCQLSNSLHVAARQAGCEITERHAHTAEIPNSPFPAGDDATVFWNYVDLRFRTSGTILLRVKLSQTHLVVRFETPGPGGPA